MTTQTKKSTYTRFNWDSTPAVNILQFAPELLEGMGAKRIALDRRSEPCVEWLKGRLGRQSYCWVGEYRFWVWELYDEQVRIFASNIQGWSFEVQESLKPVEVKSLWDRLVRDLESPNKQ